MENRAVYHVSGHYSWDTIARRLESCARGRGTRILTVSVVVCEGKPIHWTTPEVKVVEPASKTDKFVALLTGEA